jgi:ABC-type ATPase involved in cell division
MLTEFSIGNYQAFSTPQRVPLKPITLIFGPNSAGKSALLRSLLVIKHALLNHSMSKSEGAHSLHPGQVCEYTRGMGTIPLTLKVQNTGEHQDLNEHITFSANLLRQEGKAVCESVEWSKNGLPYLRSKSNKETKTLVPVFVADELHPTPEEVSEAKMKTGATFEDIAKTWLTEFDRGLPSEHSFAQASSIDPASPFLKTLNDSFTAENFPKDPSVVETFRALIEKLSRLEKSAGRRARAQMHRIASTFHAALSSDLQNMAYHEPLRPVPARIEKEDKDNLALSEWWMLATNPDLLARVNSWFASNPHTNHHRLNFHHLLPVSDYSRLVAQLGGEITMDQALESAFEAKMESDEEFSRELCEEHMYGVGDWDDENPEESYFDSKEEAMDAAYHYLTDNRQAIDKGRDYYDKLNDAYDFEGAAEFMLSGVNALKKSYASNLEAPWKHFERATVYFEVNGSKTKVPPSNLGIGFSQMIPLVSSALSSENRLIAIEQPELHIHPGLQTELADLFILSAKERGNRFLIETHSEHLILRLLRRVRETTEGGLAHGHPPLFPSDICVLYVEPTEQGSKVIELPVTADGDFSCPWPNGFFEERSAELF